MRLSGKQAKQALSIALCLVLLVTTVAFVLTVHAQETDNLAATGDTTYYLWGESTNSPNFNGSTPTGTSLMIAQKATTTAMSPARRVTTAL